MNSSSFSRIPTAFIGALLLVVSSCGTAPTSAPASRPGSGLTEYLALVDQARQAVASALNSLGTLNAQAPAAPASVVSAFSQEVDRLAVASLGIRARSQAMQTRGDAYFENWRENMESIADRNVRDAAELHRSDLQQSFASIKATLQQTRVSFQAFLAGLRKLRSGLDKDPALLASGSTRELAGETRQHGLAVEQGLDAVAAELRKMMLMLTPADSAKK
jgi:hypothetical protein